MEIGLQFHRGLLNCDEEYFRNYSWNKDYRLKDLDSGKTVAIYKKNIGSNFTEYLKAHNVKVHFKLKGIKYIRVWYTL